MSLAAAPPGAAARASSGPDVSARDAVALPPGRRRALALGAAALALASFFSYANLAIGAWATLLARQRVRPAPRGRPRRGVRRRARAFYALLAVATGYDPIGVLRATESVYREGIASRRPYAFWVFGSPVAFLVALGLPIAWFALRAAGARYAPAVALAIVVLIAAVLGFSKAETERIYQFLVPLGLRRRRSCAARPLARPRRSAALAVQALAIELLLYTVW